MARAKEAFTNPKPTPRPASATGVAANIAAAYSRGLPQYQKLTGKKIPVPSYCEGENNFPPAKTLLENQ